MESSKYAPSSEASYSHPAPATDEFAQTRAPDNLFEDDFDLIEEPEITIPAAGQPPINAPTAPSKQRSAGRGARRGGSNAPRITPTDAPIAPASEDATPGGEPPRTEAVRGDRSRTGGIKKTKLTEAELSARMETIKLKNATLEAAHARAEADEASFHQREEQEQEKRRQERQNRQQMMGEREKNRLRKLKAVGGREWDVDKAETEALENAGSSQFRRGAFGGVAFDRQSTPSSTDLVQQDVDDAWGGPVQETRGHYRGRGRGQGQGRGRGRGGAQTDRNDQRSKREQVVPKAEDFPALGGSRKQVETSSGWGEPTKTIDRTSGWGETTSSNVTLGNAVPGPDPGWSEAVPTEKKDLQACGLDTTSLPAKGASWAEEMD